MKDNLLKRAASAKFILVPKGDDSQPCLQAFETATGIVVPEFKDRKLEVRVGEQTFLKVKGRDIPALIAAGYGDIGLTGSDSCEDFLSEDNTIAYQAFGEKMCSFSLLAPVTEAEAVRQRLKDVSLSTLVATSFPRLLSKCASRQDLKLRPTTIQLSGSVEIMPRLLGVPLVADLVATGKTAQANGLVEVKSLMDVYPAIVIRNKIQQPKTNAFDDLELIDATLAKRGLQVDNLAIESTTMNLLRDSNKAGKKAGEEFGEVMMAIFGNGSVADCESEVADLIYAQLAAAYSRNKPMKLANIVQILIERNRKGAKR